MMIRRVVPFFLLLITTSASAGTDDLFVRSMRSIGDTLRSANMVLFDAEGRMTTFTERDVSILEGTGRARIISVRCPTPDTTKTRLSSVLTIDVSGSMKAGAPNLLLAKEAARAWIAALEEGSDCALTTFDHEANVLLDFTNDKQRLYSALDDLQPHGGTNFGSGFIDEKAGGLSLASSGRNRRVLVFLTDGNGMISSSAVAKAAADSNVTIYCVSLGEPVPPSLQRIAEQTGGLWFQNVTTVEQARMAYRRIYADATGNGGCVVTWEQQPSCDVRTTIIVRVAEGEWSTTINQPPQSRASVNVQPASLSFKDGTVKQQRLTLTTRSVPTTIVGVRVDRPDLVKVQHASLPRTVSSGGPMTIDVQVTSVDSLYQVARIQFDASPCPLPDIYVGIGDPSRRPKEPTLRVVHPNGGERFPVRSSVPLEWEGLPPDVPVRVEISTNGGYEWREIAKSRTTSKLNWSAIRVPTDSCLLRVTQLKDDNVATRPVLTLPGGGFFQVSYAPDGQYIATSESTGSPGSRATRPVVKVWDASSGALLRTLGGGEYITFNESGSLMVTWDHHDVRAYAMPEGQQLWKMDMKRGVNTCAVDAAGSTVLVAGGPGDSTYVLDARTGTVRHTLQRRVDRVFAAVISNDGRAIATAEHDGVITIFDGESGRLKISIRDEEVSQYFTLAFSPNGKVLASTASHGRATLWNTSDGKRLHDVSRRRYINDNTYIAFSADGSRVAVESNTDQTSIIDVATGEPVVAIRRTSDVGGASGAGFLGEGSRMYVDVLTKVAVFDAHTGVQIAEIRRGGGSSSAPRDGNRLAVIDQNRNVQVYELQSPLLQQDVSDGLWSLYESSATMKEVELGQLAVGQVKDSMIVALITNHSKQDTLFVRNATITGTHADEFSHAVPTEFFVPPLDSASFGVAFHPRSAGKKLATLTLTTDGDRLAGRLSGEGLQSVLGARSGKFDLGRHAVGSTVTVPVDSFLVNTGTESIRVLSIAVIGPHESDYAIASQQPVTLAAGDDETVEVIYSPTAPGRSYTRVAITVEGLDAPVYATVTAIADTGSYITPLARPAPLFADPTTFRSIMIPSAVIPKQGTITTAVYDIVGLAATASITDFLALQVGGVIPLPTSWLGAPPDKAVLSTVWSAGARLGFDLGHNVIVGGGYQLGQSTYDRQISSGLDSRITFHALWSTAGYGTDDSRVNVYLGYAFKNHTTLEQGQFTADAFIYGLAYDHRFAQQWKVVVETFFMRSMDFVPVTVGVRYFRESDAFDLGVSILAIPASGAEPPAIPVVPMLSWVKRW
jgi:WD40 repeat protein